jgi:hypothetical protein
MKRMPKNKTELQKAIGKLISNIQKEWGYELGESYADFSEDVMNAAHDLLKAGTADNIKSILGSRTLKQYLGETWVQKHPEVKLIIESIELLLYSQ